MSAKHPALAHHFDNLEQQKEAASLGMWIFLATELMLFGGLFTSYTVYRFLYPGAFSEASGHLSQTLATLNTALLLGSSLTMALAVHAAQVGQRKALTGYLLLTAALGLAFLGLKAIEYRQDYEEGFIPLRGMFDETKWTGAEVAGAARADYVVQVKLFFVLYFIMTGIHATHMIIGIAVLLALAWMAWRGAFSPEYHPQVELTGLYWHFVDVVWIFLFPLLYLLGGH